MPHDVQMPRRARNGDQSDAMATCSPAGCEPMRKYYTTVERRRRKCLGCPMDILSEIADVLDAMDATAPSSAAAL